MGVKDFGSEDSQGNVREHATPLLCFCHDVFTHARAHAHALTHTHTDTQTNKHTQLSLWQSTARRDLFHLAKSSL